MRSVIRPALLAALALVVAARAEACFHAPREYAGSFEKDSQQALILYEKGREELVVMMSYKLPGEKDPPDSMGWVIPVPSVPDRYDVESAKVFEDLFRLNEANASRMDGKYGGPTGGGGAVIELLAKVNVGDYEIQPIRAKGAEAGKALNEWLAKSGFGEADEASTRYYVEKGWTFLAVRILKEKAEKSLAKEGNLRPLRISFAADRIYYPLKFSSSEGPFGVTLYVLTPERLFPDRDVQTEKGSRKSSDDGLARLRKFGFAGSVNDFAFKAEDLDWEGHLAKVTGGKGYEALVPLLAKIRKEGAVTFDRGWVTKLAASKINTKEAPMSKWTEDFSLPVGAPSAEKAAGETPKASLPEPN